MLEYTLKRLLAVVPTLILVSIIVFSAVRLIPGDTIDLILAQGDVAAAAENRADIERALGLDKPVIQQYVTWLYGIINGDLGTSLWRNTSVSAELAQTLPKTIQLGLLSLVVSLSIALPIGIYSAIRQDTLGDYAARSFSLVMLAVPSFWLGTLVMVFPSVWWRWSPPLQYTPFAQDPAQYLSHMLVPAVILGLSISAVTMRMTRTTMLEVLRKDYIRTARSKGLARSIVILRHALPNALIPVVTLVGLQAPMLIGGSVIIEQIFQIPGMGILLLEAVMQRDYPIISAIFLIVGVGILLINLLVDLTYGLLDPRIRQS